MTRTILLLFVLAGLSSFKTISFQSTDINGIWFNQQKDAKIKIYATNGKHYGYIIWLKEPIDPATGKPKLDKNNPDDAKKNQSIKGLEILKNLVWDNDDQEWSDGKIYDPKSGNTYSLTCKLKDSNTMELRGYMGISLLGRTDIWTKTTE
jgi:uncharacterized protein (DUF2147 family)